MVVMTGSKPKRVQKVKFFSQREAILISEVSMMKIRKLEEGIVVPLKDPATLYTWKQVIFLRVLFYIRQRWSIQQIEKALKSNIKSIPEIIESLNEFVYIEYGDFNDSNKLEIIINDASNDSTEMHMIDEDLNDFNMSIKKDFFKISTLNINEIVRELKKRGEDLKIEYFDLKIE